MLRLQGRGVALVTPFTKSSAVDYKVFKKLVKRQILNPATSKSSAIITAVLKNLGLLF